MPEFFEDVPVDAFALPGDEELLNRISAGPQAEEPVVEEAPQQPRDEKGRFASAQEEQPEPEAEYEEPETEAVPVEETPAEQPLLAGKYKSAEDLERAYKELEQRQGQMSNELGELRSLKEQVAQINERVSQPPPEPQQPITQDMIVENPSYAAELAYSQDNGPALAAALSEWDDVDPVSARIFRLEKRHEIALKQQREEFEAKLSPLVQHTESSARASADAQFIAALGEDEKKFVASDDIDKIASEFPLVGNQLLDSNPMVRAEAVKTLHELHRGRISDTLQVTQTEVARETAKEAQAAREEAFVASASTTSTGTKPSLAEEIASSWADMRRPYDEGWNVP